MKKNQLGAAQAPKYGLRPSAGVVGWPTELADGKLVSGIGLALRLLHFLAWSVDSGCGDGYRYGQIHTSKRRSNRHLDQELKEIVDQATFVSFVAAAAKRAVVTNGRIGHLVLMQATDSLEPKLREPEMRHALSQVAEVTTVWYGIESPTTQGYRFTLEPGDRLTSARHDFVLLAESDRDADKSNLLELEGQPKVTVNEYGADCPMIRKDLQTLILEKAVDGKCMLHLCHAADSGTIPKLLGKYNAAIAQAIRLSKPVARPSRFA